MSDTRQRLHDLQRRYVDSLPQKRSELAAAWDCWCSAPADATRTQVQHLVHRLNGSAAGYGFVRIGLVAQRLDSRLIDWAASPPAQRVTEAVLIENLRPDMDRLLDALAVGQSS